MQPVTIEVTNPRIDELEDGRIEQTASKLKKIESETTPEDQSKVVELYNTGHHVRTISGMTGIELESVRSIIRKKTNCTTMICPTYTDKFKRKYNKQLREEEPDDFLSSLYPSKPKKAPKAPTPNEEKFRANSRDKEKTAEKDLIDNFLTLTQEDELPVNEDLISKLIGKSQILTRTEIINILADHGHINAEDYLDPIKRPEPKMDFAEFKKTLKVGDVFRIRSSRGDGRVRVTIQKIYPNVVTTDKGCYQIAELYIGKKIDPDDQTPDPQEDERPFSFSLEED